MKGSRPEIKIRTAKVLNLFSINQKPRARKGEDAYNDDTTFLLLLPTVFWGKVQ